MMGAQSTLTAVGRTDWKHAGPSRHQRIEFDEQRLSGQCDVVRRAAVLHQEIEFRRIVEDLLSRTEFLLIGFFATGGQSLGRCVRLTFRFVRAFNYRLIGFYVILIIDRMFKRSSLKTKRLNGSNTASIVVLKSD